MENEVELKEIKPGIKFTVECDTLNHEGQGVCRITGKKEDRVIENFPLFVNDFLPHEKGIVEIVKVSKHYGYAKLLKLFKETAHTDRIDPYCPHAGFCGGCNIMHMNYSLQLRFKQKMVIDTLRKIGGIDNAIVRPVIGMDNPIKYRNKVQVPFRKKGYKTICGFFRRDSHEVIPFENCYIQSDISSEIIHFTRNLCNEFKIQGYNEENGNGLIRHVLVRTNSNITKAMVVLVMTGPNLPFQEEFIAKLIKRYPIISSVIINVNAQKGNTILGETCLTIYGEDTIQDELCGLIFRIGPKSFYQVNPTQTEKLYQKAIELGELKPTDTLIDAYCGIGTIGLIAAKHVKEVYAVEIVEEAIQNAKQNAKNNRIRNIHFICNKAEKQIVDWHKQHKKIDAIVVDPPRKGCDQILLDTISEMGIPKMIYVSCDPATLARDLKYMREKGYRIGQLQPVDMFPMTSNVETIAILSRDGTNE
ncbi:MAG: 23S rRNA (uracil(1939)-C(5))-methyltransferase RlmD [Prevotella sp.]|nr:23S rRNA (uracil(1939)-C(5))-methyltransferase RlmD [Staphylococcus sp.]MCM1350501.1 23S rRNA (uracil(1939)-C(5))-methyltransferase RlmD [Prevotella sp.]